MWSKLVTFLSTVVPTFIKKHVSVIVLRALGLTGGVWSWVVTILLTAIWVRIQNKLHVVAKKEDQENIDELNQKKYLEDKKSNASKETIIKDETNLLNGTKPTD